MYCFFDTLIKFISKYSKRTVDLKVYFSHAQYRQIITSLIFNKNSFIVVLRKAQTVTVYNSLGLLTVSEHTVIRKP